MLTLNGNFQHIDWRHDAVEPELHIGDHMGTLESYIIIPNLVIGISDYLNFSCNQVIGIRSMNWGTDGNSIHHRDESSLDDYKNSQDFIQAIGGLFGDTSLKLRYLYKNVGMKEGSRIYFGAGLSIPSKSVLTESPFLVIEEDWPEDNESWTGEHRHFSLSDGAYKGLLEIQMFNKRLTNPVFYGLVTNIAIPIDESKYGFMPGISYSIVSSLVYSTKNKNSNLFPIGFTFGLSFIGTTEALWHGESTPNSKSRLITPSLGGVWNISKGNLSLNIQKPMFITGSSGDDLDNEANAIEIVFGYRRNLGYMIPWL